MASGGIGSPKSRPSAPLQAEMEERVASAFNLTLRKHQIDALSSICAGKDTIVSLPTGSGKSMCFEAITTVLCSSNVIIIVVSPLAFLLQAEVKKLASLGVSAVYVGDKKSYNAAELEAGKYRYVLGNPEQFLTDGDISKILRTDFYKKHVHTIVYDEVHTAVSWGLSKDSQSAFRSYFSKIGDLRGIFPDAAMMCLTATASKTTQAKIKEMFSLRNPNIIAESPDRKNIRLFFCKVKDVTCLDWLLKLMEIPEQCPRTIIYCRRFQDCSLIYNYFSRKIGKNPACVSDRIYDMVHSKTPGNVKDFIGNELVSTDSRLRLVIATKVLGMGLDIKCDQVVHYGPPSTVDDYIQQIGRAGRNQDTQAHAILLYNGKQLRNVESGMLDFLRSTDKCLRALALRDYTTSVHQFERKHNCCSICASECDCGDCESFQNGFEKHHSQLVHDLMADTEEESEIEFRTVSEEERLTVISELYKLKNDLDNNIITAGAAVIEPELHHGLTPDIIHQILEELPNLFSVDDVLSSCYISNYETACNIVLVLSDIFNDMDNDLVVGDDDVTSGHPQ